MATGCRGQRVQDELIGTHSNALVSGSPNTMSKKQNRTFVLVHGAGHGGWVWSRVRDRLNKKGYRVFSPTLTGLGDRSHLLSKDITLETHIQDVVNVFTWEDIRDAVLVGHSYAGWVISGATERVADRLDGLVYLDAFLPDDGQRGVDLMNAQQQAAVIEAIARGDVTRPGPTSIMLKIQKPDDAAWVDAKITPQPLAVAMQPLSLTGAREKIRSKLYIRAPLFAQPVYDAALERCKKTPGWDTAVMHECGHDPMVDQPDALCDLLENV